MAACGGSSAPADTARPAGSTAAPARAIPLGRPPAAVERLCRQAARRTFARCPKEFPRSGDSDRIVTQMLTPRGYAGYLLSFNDLSFHTSDGGHVILGGQPKPLELGGRPGRRWPQRAQQEPDDELKVPARLHGPRRLVLLQNAEVGGADAIVLRAARYPIGGVHGGHVIVLWNAGGHGQMVSLHFATRRYSERDRVTAALAVARSESPPE
jgi:hypothetical protein